MLSSLFIPNIIKTVMMDDVGHGRESSGNDVPARFMFVRQPIESSVLLTDHGGTVP